ncbi:MAG: hypothetical protein P4M06_13500 [Pandoraea sp.]|nr:hypothetical protein [Pandoraea sp.]MDR3398560.1 hypothetical protein [Pandoraea sp.]
MPRQENYENVVGWAKKIRKDPGKSKGRGNAGVKPGVVRPPGQVAFTGFAVWQGAKGAFVTKAQGAADGSPLFGNPKRASHIARYADFASARMCALKVGAYGLVIYAVPDGTVFIVG